MKLAHLLPFVALAVAAVILLGLKWLARRNPPRPSRPARPPKKEFVMFDLSWKVWAAVAAVITAIATGLYLLGVIPWWGILIAVPVATVIALGGLLIIGTMMWMAGGSH